MGVAFLVKHTEGRIWGAQQGEIPGLLVMWCLGHLAEAIGMVRIEN